MPNDRKPSPSVLAEDCPFCGAVNATVPSEGHGAFLCFVCGAKGPQRYGHEAQVEAWNHRASPWQPIETAPKDGTKLLLYGRWFDYMGQVSDNVRSYTGCSGYELGSYDTMMGFWRVTKEYPCFEPSHWMQLPPTPEV